MEDQKAINEDGIKVLRNEADRLVKIHNERAEKILTMAKTGVPKDTIKGEIYELQADEDDVNRFFRENREVIVKNEEIAGILASIEEPHKQVLGVIRDLQIGR